MNILQKKFLPKTVFNSLVNNNIIKSYLNLLKNRSGIYSLVNKINGKQGIGSVKYLYLCLLKYTIGKNLINIYKLLLENMV